MESLTDDGAQTVPHIAMVKSVSRQHIQVNVDALLAARLVTLQDNPSHKRSPFVVLTSAGCRAFATIRRREARLLDRLATELNADRLKQTAMTIGQLQDSIVKTRKKGGPHE